MNNLDDRFDQRDRIYTRATALKEDLIRFLRELIAIPSFSGKEKDVVLRIKREMEFIGYDRIGIDAFGNLLGRIGCGT